MTFLSGSVQEINSNYVQPTNYKVEDQKSPVDEASIFTLNSNTYNVKNNDYNEKISFKEGASAVLGGAKDMISDTAKQIGSFAKEHPLLAGCVAAGTAALGVSMAICAPIAVIGGIGLAGIGGYNLFKRDGSLEQTKNAVKEYNNANNKKEAIKALHDVGYNGADAAGDALSVVAGASVAVNGAKALSAGIKATAACDNYASMKFLNGTEAAATRKADSDAVVKMLLEAEADKALSMNVAFGAPISAFALSDDLKF